MFSFLFLSKFMFFFSCLGFLTSLPYAFWLYNRISFFMPFSIFVYSDVTKREFVILFCLFFNIIFLGIFPSFIFDIIEMSVLKIFVYNNALFLS